MKIQFLDPNELKPYHLNPRINDHAVDDVARSIKENGFNQPIVVDQNKTICVGETRWKASVKLGLDKVPVYVKDMSEKEFIAYNIADNKVGEKSIWEEDKLKENLSILIDFDYNLGLLGFNDRELEQLLNLNMNKALENADEIEANLSIGSEKNKEINISDMKSELHIECPKCGHFFTDKNK